MKKKKIKSRSSLKSFTDFYQNQVKTQNIIIKKVQEFEKLLLDEIFQLSKRDRFVYPDQGLLITPFDYLNIKQVQMLPQETILKAIQSRIFFLELFNHPYRIDHLLKENNKKFLAPPKIDCPAINHASKTGLSLSVGDIGALICGSTKPRESRTQRYAKGPFVKIGKQARALFVGSSSPDVWNSSLAIATMAASHCFSGIPRNGVLNDIDRQKDVAKETFKKLDLISSIILKGRINQREILKMWKRNVMGTLEASPDKALVRAQALYNTGVRTFRVYSPEPGSDPVTTTYLLRKKYKNSIEIVTSLIVDVNQAKAAQEVGADAIIIGIGGGGRCITGVRSGSVIGWPQLLFDLRGEISIPTIVEGGASDHIAVTLLLGASGISVSRVVSGGTLESPGGALYCLDSEGNMFKPYGGEASARTKYLDKKLLPFKIPSFVEGDTSEAKLSYIKHILPTLTYNLHFLTEDAILAMVFRNVSSINELHNINPSPLRYTTIQDLIQKNLH